MCGGTAEVSKYTLPGLIPYFLALLQKFSYFNSEAISREWARVWSDIPFIRLFLWHQNIQRWWLHHSLWGVSPWGDVREDHSSKTPLYSPSGDLSVGGLSWWIMIGLGLGRAKDVEERGTKKMKRRNFFFSSFLLIHTNSVSWHTVFIIPSNTHPPHVLTSSWHVGTTLTKASGCEHNLRLMPIDSAVVFWTE